MFSMFSSSISKEPIMFSMFSMFSSSISSGSKSKERKKSSERDRSLRKSSSEGLLRIFRRTSFPKEDQPNKEFSSEGGKEFSPLTPEEDSFNKAFRSGTGPLILVPQPKNEKERLKKVTNKGIQQISQQQAKQIFKDHQKLKEELFKEVPQNLSKEIKPKSTLPKPLSESSKTRNENKEKTVSNVTSKAIDLKDELKHSQISKESQSKQDESLINKSSIQDKRTEISINKLPIQNKQTETSVNKPLIQVKLTDTLANKPPIAPLGNKIQKDKPSKSIPFLENAALGIKKTTNQHQKTKSESPSFDNKNTQLEAPVQLGSVTVSQHPNLHSKSSSLDSADFKSRKIEESSFNIRKYSNPSELSQKQKILRDNQEKTILNLHRKHLEEISKLRHGDLSIDDQSKGSTSEEKGNKDDMIRTSFMTRSKTFDNYNLSKYITGNENVNVEGNLKTSSTTVVTSTADEDKSPKKPLSDNVEPFSFSNYLTRTRKDSVGDKEKPPPSLSKLSEEIQLKTEVLKKVHFPDDVKILNESKDLNVELISSKLSSKSHNSSENGDTEKSNVKEVGKPPLPKTNTVSILKRSPNSKDNVNDNVNSKSSSMIETKYVSIQKDSDIHGEREINETPVKPPRGEKNLKRQRSSSLTDSKSPEMTAPKLNEERVLQKTIFPKNNEEVNSRPFINEDQLFTKTYLENTEKSQDLKKEDEGNQIKQIQKNQNDQPNTVADQSQKKKTSAQQQIHQEQVPLCQKLEQQSQPPVHHQPQVNQSQQQDQSMQETNKSVEVLKKQIHESSKTSSVSSYYGSLDRKQNRHDKRPHTSVFEENQTTSPPKPPTRCNKNKGAVGVRSASPHSKQEGVLVCACRVAEEDQILRLLKDLSKTQKFDYEFINQTDQTGRLKYIK
ncbi:hypothetical protein Anas_08961 [Armadillidium nasatum]|uniref:Uncharacterized protein n=1 Tax=Armadillidium nasatum TaxID=96803 RepID=A0A5N5T104_9CRUS|nr:hypothetical protein Anas_08961 [Armadillidium nasatum]